MSKATVRTDLLNRRVRELEASAIVCDRESRQLKEAAVQKKNPQLLHTGCERREGEPRSGRPAKRGHVLARQENRWLMRWAR